MNYPRVFESVQSNHVRLISRESFPAVIRDALEEGGQRDGNIRRILCVALGIKQQTEIEVSTDHIPSRVSRGESFPLR